MRFRARKKREIFLVKNGKANRIVMIHKANNLNNLKFDPKKEKDKT